MALGKLFGKLFGGSPRAQSEEEPVDYKGFTIVPAPIAESGQYRTAGSIRREHEGQVQTVRYIRADNNSNREASVQHSIAKARQIIDERGAAIFDQEMV